MPNINCNRNSKFGYYFNVKNVLFVLFFLLNIFVITDVHAQEGGIIWEEPFNISRTPDATSTDPFLLADPAGVVHLFWAEKASSQQANNPDTLMYTWWDGNNWSEPIDIYFAPIEHGTLIVQYPHAVLDDQGTIHLIWLSQPNFPNYALFYSSVPANNAHLAQAWKPASILADDLTGTNYSLDIKTDNDQNIHIVYSRVPGGVEAPELRSVSYIHSKDAGETWSDSVDIHTIHDPLSGASNNRLIVDDQGNLYTTWSEWDLSGNGQAIYFTRSLDNGTSWEKPIVLTERLGNEYERDWNNIALLEPETLVAVWEGGWRAYRNIMYSYDGGETWTEPVDAFPGLIGENGFIEFARDSEDTLHMFFANRAREGNNLRTGEGLWHSVWNGGENWSEPILSSPNINMLNPKAVIVNGNEVMSTWYVGADSEIMAMEGEISQASSESPVLWPNTFIEPTLTLSPTSTAQNLNHIPSTEQSPLPDSDLGKSYQESSKPWRGISLGLIVSVTTIFGLVILRKLVFRKW